uniref:Tyramine receptor Ser-2 n=1 Tax=Phallusia mammillata TaxID=59560 RepID=A0A6F9DE76_9ASCI|nr:tyramine receptor Ser-2 [Phallusia mammillata]
MDISTTARTQESINPRFFPGLNPEILFRATDAANTSHPAQEYHPLCAPYPLCDPMGCGTGSPIDCGECDKAGVGIALVGMCLLALVIVICNLLVIMIITRTPTLQRRHCYIKVSLAVADLLIGLLVLPSSIYNLSTTLYLPPTRNVTPRDLIQTNQVASVFFGTVLIVSLTASIYNLLLLSLDRFLAVARPLQNRSGKYFSRQRLSICIGIVWFIGILVSSLPAMMSQRFSYVMHPTTFFYVMTTVPSHVGESRGTGPIALFALVVMGIPYFLTVTFNLVTLTITLRKLATRERLGSMSGSLSKSKRARKTEEAKRLKMILDSCPEMSESSGTKSGWFAKKGWNWNNHNNDKRPGRLSQDRLESMNASFTKNKKPVNLNYRVTRMIISMVVAFTVCICPYVVVNGLMVDGSLNCSNVGVVYNIVSYLVLINSVMNFCIYNLWHREFRHELVAVLTCAARRNERRKSSNGFGASGSRQWPIVRDSGKLSVPSQLSSGVSSFQANK